VGNLARKVQACSGLENTVGIIVPVNKIVRCEIWEVILSIIVETLTRLWGVD